jgi:16S rRNA (adenine1518-N6/adenine1519-N6)-dimethyltransferase
LNLAEPAVLKEFLGRHGIHAAKGLGQHFLVSAKAVRAIVEALDGLKGLLEIGPGPGVLTSPLSDSAERLVALELDDRMIHALAESAPRAEVRKEDALKADFRAILATLPAPRGVVSNLPYYITGPLLTRIAEVRDLFDAAVLMMQREVAARVLAGPKTSERGSLSVFLQSQFKITVVAQVPAGAFMPPPKVDSTVLLCVPKPLPVPVEEEERFFRLVRLGFGQPRKTIVNNLVAGYGMAREAAVATVASASLSERARPQELGVENWVALLESLKR